MTLVALIVADWLFGPALLFLGLLALGGWRRRRQNDELLRLALLRESMASVWLELSKYTRLSKIGQSFTCTIVGCARCYGDGHEDLEWQPFTHPIEYGDHDGFVATHWCLCPTNDEPILMGGYDDEGSGTGVADMSEQNPQTERNRIMKPTIGRIVIYTSRTGDYEVPAIITATTDTLNPKGVELGHVPPLSSERHVHLTCFTAGKPGMRRGAQDFKVGCYQEWDIPLHDEPNQGDPGTCRWPQRVA